MSTRGTTKPPGSKKSPGRKKNTEPGAYTPFKNVGQRGVDATITGILLSRNSPIDMHELGCLLLEEVGGNKKLAKLIIEDLKNAIAGSPERIRMADLLYRVLDHTARNKSAFADEASNEDLELAAMDLIRKIGVPSPIEWVYHVCI